MKHMQSPLFPNRLFIDLDGFMADFRTHYVSVFNHEYTDEKESQDILKANVIGHDTFYRDMPLCIGAKQFYDWIKFLDPIVLTSCLKESYTRDGPLKIDWVHRMLDKEALTILAYGSATKHVFLQRPGDILIDDYALNIERWRAVGGVGIHHTGDFNQTWAELVKHLEVVAPMSVKALVS